MSLSDRLRAEARTIRPTADAGLAARVAAAVRAAPPAAPLPFPRQRLWPWLAAAAVLAVAVGLAWPRPAPPPVVAPVAVRSPITVPIPVMPTLNGLLASLPSGGPLTSELNALGADLVAAAQTVRKVVPF